jgi:iron complex outermembrane receptor protein
VALFQITRPVAADLGTCDDPGTCTRAIDGEARHRGVDAQAEATLGAWRLAVGAMWLDAERRGSRDASLNGLRPTNVAERSLRLGAEWRVPAVEGLSLGGNVLHEGDRIALPDNSARTGAWTRLDLAARWVRRAGPATWTLRVGVDNATDERAWTDTPYQFGHAYLFPMAPRTWRASLQADL